MMPSAPHVYGHQHYQPNDSSWMHQQTSHQHHAQAAAAAANAAQQQHYSRIAGQHGSISALNPSAHTQDAGGSGLNGTGVSEENQRTLNYIADLLHENTREAALLELSKKREQVPELALILWHSFGVMTSLLQEIISVYTLLNPSQLTAAASNRVCNALALLQCVASHNETRTLFLNAHIPLFLYPFLNTTSKSRPFEYLRLTSLGVIGALVKNDSSEVINFLLTTEIIPLCLRIMETGSELSKTVAIFIVQKILLDDAGLAYICATYERFYAVGTVLSNMVAQLVEQQTARLLKHVVRCFLRLSDNARAREALRQCLPEPLRDATFSSVLRDDAATKRCLTQLLINLSDNSQGKEWEQQGCTLPCDTDGYFLAHFISAWLVGNRILRLCAIKRPIVDKAKRSATMPAAHYHRVGPTAPRRFIAAAVSSVVYWLILAMLAHPHFACADRSNPFQQKARAATAATAAPGDKYLIGVGKADITGPVVELNLAGYASLDQVGSGLRQRLYSRAFIIGEVAHPENRFVYLVLDAHSGDSAVRFGILEGLAALGPDYSMYRPSNVAVTGTHSHAGPGGFFNYLLLQITSLGFSKQSYQAIVDGALLSIQRAHKSLVEGTLDFGTTNVTDASINRSLYAYLANPASERAQYADSVETTLTMLRFRRASDGKNIGVLTWFPTHGTSLMNNNTHIAGDNKGVAAYLFEQAARAESSAADGFVAGFSQASVGDTSPNVLGAYCEDGSGAACKLEDNSCPDGTTQSCHGRGPMFQVADLGVSSCYEIGRRQYTGAKTLYDSLDATSTAVEGPTVRSFHFYQDMRYFQFPLPNGTMVQTCPAALGQSFSGGTSDGPAVLDFTAAAQDPLYALALQDLKAPPPQQVACQSPKQVLFDVGDTDQPYPLSPNIVDMQTLRVGQFIIIVSSSEATTMSGRRWKSAVKAAAIEQSLSTVEPMVVLGGPANTYAHYCVTPEEYGVQRYEGASTLYGPWELYAYINLTLSHLHYLKPTSDDSPPPGPMPPDNRNVSSSYIKDVPVDAAAPGSNFGDVITQPRSEYATGEVVNVTFVGANPRNNLRLEGTFAAVEQLSGDGKNWTQVRSDADWHLVYTWTQTDEKMAYSSVVISWETGPADDASTYRIVYYGDYKTNNGALVPFNGTSQSFALT
ncbi:hypothetical protein P8C59_008696 [Phyllachora maydis]|uniref:ceramidase n=1 Tax=Phyllachora maydis TaxID=1825666 RepID=A0AAD9MIS1_9PEZI|nr:hypothetical protein P8C59_008696 [Phyllachora maydis]